MKQEKKQELKNRIIYANPTQLIAIVYEIAETHLEEAITAFENDKMDDFDANVNKATKCLGDLTEALDMQYELSHNLLELYTFFNKALALSVVKRDVETVKRIKPMLNKLRVSFEKLAADDNSEALMKNTQEVYAGLTYGKGSLNESTISQDNRGFIV